MKLWKDRRWKPKSNNNGLIDTAKFVLNLNNIPQSFTPQLVKIH